MYLYRKVSGWSSTYYEHKDTEGNSGFGCHSVGLYSHSHLLLADHLEQSNTSYVL